MLTLTFKNHSFMAGPAMMGELAPLRAFIVSLVGDVTPLEGMIEMTRQNSDWLHAIRYKGKDGYAGAFAILPLGQEASALFAANQMTGKDIRIKHMVRNSADAASIYVGSIQAVSNVFARAATMKAFNESMQRLTRDCAIPCYTRPVTQDGQRVVTKLGYKPVIDRPHKIGEMIYRRDPKPGL